MPISASDQLVRSERPASSKETVASAGNTTSERTVGARTSADAMIAAAQRTAFAMRYLRPIVIPYGSEL
jgi:hypothetical protein